MSFFQIGDRVVIEECRHEHVIGKRGSVKACAYTGGNQLRWWYVTVDETGDEWWCSKLSKEYVPVTLPKELFEI